MTRPLLCPSAYHAKLHTHAAGWPIPPAQEPWCSVCPAGWASTAVDASACTMCRPGHYAASPDSPACLPCPRGTYSTSWGSSQCSHCIVGTFSSSQVLIACSPQPYVTFSLPCESCTAHAFFFAMMPDVLAVRPCLAQSVETVPYAASVSDAAAAYTLLARSRMGCQA